MNGFRFTLLGREISLRAPNENELVARRRWEILGS
jgi:hypothetical protein